MDLIIIRNRLFNCIIPMYYKYSLLFYIKNPNIFYLGTYSNLRIKSHSKIKYITTILNILR